MSNQNNDNTPPPPSTQNIHIKPNTEGHAESVYAAGIVHGGVGNTYNEVHAQGDKECVEKNLRDLRAQLSVKERERQDRTDDVHNLELKIEKLKEEVETFREQTHEKREDIENIERKICKLMEDIEVKKDEIAKLEKNIIPGLKKQIEEAEIRLEVLKETVEDTTNAIPALEKQVQDLIQSLTKYGTDVKDEKESIAELYRLVRTLHNDLLDRKKDQRALTEKMQKIEEEQANQKSQLEVEQAKQKHQLEVERRANEELQRQIVNLHKVIEEKDAKNRKLEQQLKASSDVTENPTTTETQAGQGRVEHHGVTPTPDTVAALHDACWFGDVDGVRRLLDQRQVDVNCRVGEGSWTPLMLAARWGRRDLVEFLVRRGANVSLVNADGDNVLHLACDKGHEGHVETVKFLLSVMNVVDINARNNDGKTPADWARLFGRHQLLDLLRSRSDV